jgi:hypothetical protein
MKPTAHILGIPNTVCSHEFDHCGFTLKARLLSAMLKSQGYRTVEYGNEGSESEADEKVVIFSREELKRRKAKGSAHEGLEDKELSEAFAVGVSKALGERCEPQDIVLHTFGSVCGRLLQEFPGALHVEAGVGYAEPSFGAYRIYHTYAWMHYNQGRSNARGGDYEFVCPAAQEIESWPVGKGDGGVVYLGRICEDKGLNIVRAVAETLRKPVDVYGLGDAAPWKSKFLRFHGPVSEQEKRKILGSAVLCPTRYVEPFGEVAVQALLCGTPVIGPDFGGYVETITSGFNGYRCRTLGDYVAAVQEARTLGRSSIRGTARSKYAVLTCGKKYGAILGQLSDLFGAGWLSPVGRI